MNDKENYSPSKKARKSLASNWASSSGHTLNSNSLTASSATGLHMRIAHHDHSSSFEAPETPSKSLVGTSDASMLFSPPAILKETALPDDSGAGFSSADSLNMQESNYSSNQSGSMSHNSFGGPKPLGGIGNRISSTNTNGGNTGVNRSGNGVTKNGAGNSSPKSKVSHWALIKSITNCKLIVAIMYHCVIILHHSFYHITVGCQMEHDCLWKDKTHPGDDRTSKKLS